MPRGLPRRRRQYRVVRVPLKKVSHLLRKSASREYCRRVPCSSVSLRPGEGKAVVVLSCSAVTVQRQIRRSGVKRTVWGTDRTIYAILPSEFFFSPALCFIFRIAGLDGLDAACHGWLDRRRFTGDPCQLRRPAFFCLLWFGSGELRNCHRGYVYRCAIRYLRLVHCCRRGSGRYFILHVYQSVDLRWCRMRIIPYKADAVGAMRLAMGLIGA